MGAVHDNEEITASYGWQRPLPFKCKRPTKQGQTLEGVLYGDGKMLPPPSEKPQSWGDCDKYIYNRDSWNRVELSELTFSSY